eukprot:1859453-Pyramimonas_sp.AAC.1
MDLRGPHLDRASQESTKVATATQFAALGAAARSQMDLHGPHLSRASQSGVNENGDSCLVRSSPKERRCLNWICAGLDSAVPPRSPRT